MKRISTFAALSLSLIAIPAVFAADGYVTGNVNLRAGPDSSYPRVTMLQAGTPVAIEGCVDGWSWCDVATAEERGWVAGNFLQEEYQGQRVLIPEYGLQIGIPIVSFAFGSYWDQHYRSRPWYGNRDHWSRVQPRYPDMREGSYRNSRDATYRNSRGITSGDSRATYAPASRAAEESRRQTVVTVPPSYQGRPARGSAPSHPVANDFRTQERVAGHERPVERTAGGSRATAQQNGVVRQQSAESNSQHKEKAARSTPERQGGRDNERGKDKDKDQQH